jgi:hypothetical protein
MHRYLGVGFKELNARPCLIFVFGIAVAAVHYICFYWWVVDSYYFSGDGLYYFSRRIDTFSDLIARFTSVDEMFQYRPLTYVFFSFVLFPILGKAPDAYHAIAYLFSTVNAILASLCIYTWLKEHRSTASLAIVFLLINPVHFFPSFGPTYIDQWLSSFFYFAALLILLRDPPYAWVPVSFSFLLALCSKEHSVTLPMHAVLLLWSMGLPLRSAFHKTRYLWIMLAGFMLFQLGIRGGSLFAPPGTNPNMSFSISPERVLELIQGAKAAAFYPENYTLDFLVPGGNLLRMGAALVLGALVILAVRRNKSLAFSGMAWIVIALAPVLFIQQAPSARHYHLALPGFSIRFAGAMSSWRSIVLALPLFALSTVTNVALYARTSWVVVGAQTTKSYLRNIQSMRDVTGRSHFYVVAAADPAFYFHIDGGSAVPEMIERDVTFQFGPLNQPFPTDQWLFNSVNVVAPSRGTVEDAFAPGVFPPNADRHLCSLVERLTGAMSPCSILFRGYPLVASESSVAETPNGLPVFSVSEGIVTLSRTAVRIPSMGGFVFNRTLRVVPESRDGVLVRIYHERERHFDLAREVPIRPGERVMLEHFVGPDEADHVIIRIHPGAQSDEVRDWVIWEEQ